MVMQAGFWAMFAGICAYQAALLYDRNFSSGDVGLIIAVRCLAGIVFQPLLGGFADRHPAIPLKHIVALSLGLSFCAGLAFIFVPMGLGGTLLVFVVIGGFEVSAYPFMDSMAIQYINSGVPIRYSLGRGVGSLAYAVCCIFLGLQAARWGTESILITHAALVALEMALVLTFPTFRAAVAPRAEAGPKPQSALALLRGNPRFTIMLCAILLALTAVIPLSNFLLDLVIFKGGTTKSLSLALFLMAASELPISFLFPRLLSRFGSGRLLVISMGFMVVKAAALLLAPSLFWLYLAQPLQMVGYGLFTPSSVFFVNESVPEADRVRGQTIMMVASNGLGGVLGSLIPGRILDLGNAHGGQGPAWMLLFSILLAGAGVLLGLLALRQRRTEG